MSVWEGGFGEQDEDEREQAFANPDGWRGDEHPDDWPEEMAGPEYWLNKPEGDNDEPST